MPGDSSIFNLTLQNLQNTLFPTHSSHWKTVLLRFDAGANFDGGRFLDGVLVDVKSSDDSSVGEERIFFRGVLKLVYLSIVSRQFTCAREFNEVVLSKSV